jgi:flavin reductase (DIM6/NTAB) family NADH-FMN oxidoreductase RutF
MATGTSRTADFRAALGMFVHVVTIVTNSDVDGNPRGMTANSFTSVSLDPPMVLVCIGNHAASYSVFQKSGGFAVNVLSDEHRGLAELFASKARDKLDHVDYRLGIGGAPVIKGSLAWLDCRTVNRVEAGDHIILIGEVEDFGTNSGSPLAYCQGGFFSFNQQQDAVLASPDKGIMVGCIADFDDKVLLVRTTVDGRSSWTLPAIMLATRDSGVLPTINRLVEELGTTVDISFIYSVFEHADHEAVHIVYRGKLNAAPAANHARLFSEGEFPWDMLEGQPIRDVIQRFFKERRFENFSVYVDFEGGGRVATVDHQTQPWSSYVSDGEK